MSNLKVAIVTGAARGIGKSVAMQLGRDGYVVIINSVRSPGDDVKAAIEQQGGRAATCQADISKSEDRKRLVQSTLEKFGRIDLLVNNAGVAPDVRADILDAPEDSFDRLIQINLKGPYFLTQLVAREMVKLQENKTIERGRICFVTSISAYTSSVNRGDYCISKAGLAMAAQLWAHRLADYAIPVIEFRPGIIATDMTSGVKEKYDKLIAEGLLPIKRWGSGEDVARAVSAFGRGDLDYSTGASIDVSGGFQMRRL